ncbi:hypothetical protein [Chitinophaga sp. Cy-1792]|uniref:hypothetical protein n=1 Tax=Chitinophaga sp. Cy-1792 TaxID=2608339 RepID=UPI001422F993|nr:hypothetical protein [Chitinophaga sp. Cy-1792]NIG55255.1 hypothetical protein [Chitinophaga sp. Cy-1792]
MPKVEKEISKSKVGAWATALVGSFCLFFAGVSAVHERDAGFFLYGVGILMVVVALSWVYDFLHMQVCVIEIEDGIVTVTRKNMAGMESISTCTSQNLVYKFGRTFDKYPKDTFELLKKSWPLLGGRFMRVINNRDSWVKEDFPALEALCKAARIKAIDHWQTIGAEEKTS